MTYATIRCGVLSAGILLWVQGAAIGGETLALDVPSETAIVRIHGTDSFGYPNFHLDYPALRDLLLSREYDRLTTQIDRLQKRFEEDFRMEFLLAAALEAPAVPDPGLQEYLDEWVERQPESYVPRLVRGNYLLNVSAAKRGNRWRMDTKQEQLDAMHRSLDLADADLTRALEINPRLAIAYIYRIALSKFRGDHLQAFADYLEAIGFSPFAFGPRVALISHLKPRWGGSYSLMQNIAERSFAWADTNPRLRLLLGWALVDQADMLSVDKQKLSDILPYFDRALELGEHYHFYFMRAWVYYYYGAYESALQDMDRAIQLWPHSEASFLHRARIHMRLYQYDAAWADLQEALRINPADGGSLLMRVELRFRQDDLKAARADLETAERFYLDPASLREMRRWGASQAERIGYDRSVEEDIDGAMEAFAAGIEFDSEYARNYMRQGYEYYRAKEYEKAETVIRTALAYDSADFHNYVQLHNVLSPAARWSDLVSEWRKYLGNQPADSRAWVQMGTAARRGGDTAVWQECVDSLEKLAPVEAKGLRLESSTNRTAEHPIEAEDMEMVDKKVRGWAVQDMEQWDRDRWSNGRQLFVKPGPEGFVILRLSVPDTGNYEIAFYGTMAPDFGVVSFSIDNEPLGASVDLYASSVVPTGKLSLGAADLTAGDHLLKIRSAGRNELSSRYFFGIDCFEVVRN